MRANHHLDGIEIAFVSAAAASFVALIASLAWLLI
ncbi:hypothetical protein ABIF14_003624 [Bradyrhizobium elkanii]